MRIAFVLNSSGLYGANRSLLGLIRYLCNQNQKCFAIIPGNGEIEEELQKLNVEYKVEKYRPCVWYPGYIGMPFLVNLINMPQIVRDVKRWNVDLIHSNSSNIDVGILAAQILKVKHIWHVREIMELFYNTKYIFPRWYKRLRAQSDAVICVSQYTFNYHKVQYPNKNIKMIYNPYDVGYYDISRSTFAPNRIMTILMAGAFAENKKQLDSVRAIDILLKRGITNVRLILAGDGDINCVNAVIDYVQAHNLEDYVEVLNFVPDLRKIREEADVALCCSVSEALPRVVVEGMLGELLSIGADSGGTAEVIQHKKTGLLYDVGDCEQLADRMEFAMENKRECFQMIKDAKQYAIDNFELERSGERVMKVYREVLDIK